MYINKNEYLEIREIYESLRDYHPQFNEVLTDEVWERLTISCHSVKNLSYFYYRTEHIDHLIQYANQNHWFKNEGHHTAIFTYTSGIVKALIYSDRFRLIAESDFSNVTIKVLSEDPEWSCEAESKTSIIVGNSFAKYLLLCYADYHVNQFLSPLEFHAFIQNLGFSNSDLIDKYPEWWEINSEENKLMRLPKYPVLAYP